MSILRIPLFTRGSRVNHELLEWYTLITYLGCMVRIIPPERLKKIYSHPSTIEVNRTYIDKMAVVRWIYWNRLDLMVGKGAQLGAQKVLDLGCGQGVFLPTLSEAFETVHGLDIDVSLAKVVVEEYDLQNVTLFQGDLFENPIAGQEYDIVFAASVLEHFQDGDALIRAIKKWIKPGGYLIFSSPTETWFYELARKVFGYTKPADHYLTTHEIADAARPHLKYISRKFGPTLVPSPFCPYCIYTFQKEG